MRSYFKKLIIIFSAALIFLSVAMPVGADTVNIDASKLLAHVEIFFSPRAGSFQEGSTFQIPIYVNTKNKSINGIEARINFDASKLSIVNPTGGTSIIGVWVEPPKFDNTHGTASYVGVIPGGITTNSGLIGTVTFKAKATGTAVVSVNSTSKILLNDGLGTSAEVDYGRASYDILSKAPEGVEIFSETHPVQDDWYNNNTPTVSWQKPAGVTGFSYELDNKPGTIPDNTVDTEDTTKSFEALPDGLWYFHIKASKNINNNIVWGSTGQFLLRIDTTPPAEFTPETNYLIAAVISTERTLVSFFTTDNLSGVDHYEVGIIDKKEPLTTSPLFVQAESPFQVPVSADSSLEVIVRAIDRAGNVRDESVAVKQPIVVAQFVKNNLDYILSGMLLLGILMLLMHYLFGHHILKYFRRPKAEILTEKEYQDILDKLP